MKIKIDSHIMIEKIILILSIFFVMLLWVLKLYKLANIVASMTLLIDIYGCIKVRKNKINFFMFLTMLYFDYSFIITKYYYNIKSFSALYAQIRFEDTKFIGITLVYLFHAILLLLLKPSFFENKDDMFIVNSNEKIKGKKKIFIFALIVMIGFIITDYLIFHVFNIPRTIYEYMIIPFIIAIYYSKNNEPLSILILLLIMVSFLINSSQGGRIISLQPLIAFFFIKYYNKVNSKRIFLVFIVGIILFTLLGLYGDNLMGDNQTLTINNTLNVLNERKFALDTSYSAYWTGLTFIETSHYIPFKNRIRNFIQYVTTYLLFGKASKYNELTSISIKYYGHWNGGYLPHYFYYWFGPLGIIVLALYIAFFFNKFASCNSNSSDYFKILYVYFVSAMPRWYLYSPAQIFRGVFLLTVVYFVVYIFINNDKSKKEINN